MTESTGKTLRARRLFKHDPERLLVVPLDHSVTDGPLASNAQYERILGALTGSGVDAVVLHKGRLRGLSTEFYKTTSVIVHVSASTRFAEDSNDKYLVASVEDAVRRGADGVSVHVNLGSTTEAKQLRDLSEVADACEQAGVPLLAMIYPRGKQVELNCEPRTLAHAASLAADLGADFVKLPLPREADEIAWVTARSPLPVLAAGGQKLDDERFLQFTQRVVEGGAAGLAAGRNIFMSEDVAGMARRTRAALDTRLPARAARTNEGSAARIEGRLY